MKNTITYMFIFLIFCAVYGRFYLIEPLRYLFSSPKKRKIGIVHDWEMTPTNKNISPLSQMMCSVRGIECISPNCDCLQLCPDGAHYQKVLIEEGDEVFIGG